MIDQNSSQQDALFDTGPTSPEAWKSDWRNIRPIVHSAEPMTRTSPAFEDLGGYLDSDSEGCNAADASPANAFAYNASGVDSEEGRKAALLWARWAKDSELLKELQRGIREQGLDPVDAVSEWQRQMGSRALRRAQTDRALGRK